MPLSLTFGKNHLKSRLAGRLKAPYVVLDYPREREVLRRPFYTIRVGAEGGQSVQVAIDGGIWRPCRWAVGYWWFDWTQITRGPHTIMARLVTSAGGVKKTKPRTCRAVF